MRTLANSEDQDEIQHNAAFHQGLHCLLRLKQYTDVSKMHNNRTILFFIETGKCITEVRGSFRVYPCINQQLPG